MGSPAPPTIRVLTACTGAKALRHARALRREDFEREAEHVRARTADLPTLPAEDLYTGAQHVRLMRGVRAARAAGLAVDVRVLSAGYGLVRGADRLAPYECTFAEIPARTRGEWACWLGIPSGVRRALAAPADLAVLLLGDAYLAACHLDDRDLDLDAPTVVFCGAAARARLPRVGGLLPVVLGNAEAKRFRCPLVALKGELGARLLARIARDPAYVRWVNDPARDLLRDLEGA